MNAASDAAFRVPVSPYPGLRPFLDHESMLLLGRGLQIREVVARLCETRFVAVIGGSGCGKSSLIRAGVVPDLRGFGIPDAGDYWVPVVFTPGTTKQADFSGECDSRGRPVQTPITRLAWKFAQELDSATRVLARRIAVGEIDAPGEPIDEEAEAEARRQDIAAMFRQGAGFSRLVHSWSDELPAPASMRGRARFLFVIDQFEELFHPNNRASPDAEAMVEAVIDHFFNPHDNCYVVLTMRSEHLADCASYLQLPDAINKSSYLVRRLDDDELREAIVGPAKYFLRLQRRGDAIRNDVLPDDVVFDEVVIRRLLADVATITDDPDHLPLLQHLLARIWESACRRQTPPGEPSRVAGRIEWGDLERAVTPECQAAPGWLLREPTTNTLRHSLENWAQAIYLERRPEERARIDSVLRNLAFKDPNNGQYSQQRVEVDDPTLFPDVGEPRAVLHRLLTVGFLDSVNYLFWDRENPAKVTLKVSHESFIRGWEHFRVLVDKEAERFDEFVGVLRRAIYWCANEDPQWLLEDSELLRIEAAGLQPVFDLPHLRSDWFSVLKQYRDGERLFKVEPMIDRFIALSRAHVQAEEDAKAKADALQKETEARFLTARTALEAERLRGLSEKLEAGARLRVASAQRRTMFAASVVMLLLLLVVLPLVAFAYLIQRPVVQSVATFVAARDLVQRSNSLDIVVPDNAGKALSDLIDASQSVMVARSRGGFVVARGWITEWASLPLLGKPVVEMRKLFVQSSSEPSVNSSLRALLTTQIWRSHGQADGTGPRIEAIVTDDAECSVINASNSERTLKGRLLKAPQGDHAMFFPQPATRLDDVTLYTVHFTNGNCVGERIAWSFPRRIAPLLLVDANLDYMTVTQTRVGEVQPAVSVYRMVWGAALPGLRFLSVSADPAHVDVVKAEFGAAEGSVPDRIQDIVRAVPTWRVPGGTGAAVGKATWRIFSSEAQAIEPANAGGWRAIEAATPGSPCASLEAELSRRTALPDFVASKTLQQDGHCFSIQRRTDAGSGASSSTDTAAPGDDAARDEIVVLVYLEPTPEQVATMASDLPQTPIASLSIFNEVLPPGEWVASNAPAHRGWIGYRSAAAPADLRGAPWSTEALRALALQVRTLDPATHSGARPEVVNDGSGSSPHHDRKAQER